MEALIYLLKVNLIFSAMYLVFRLFMQQTVFHYWIRFYLLSAPVLALLIPFISTNSSTDPIYVVQLSEVGTAASAYNVDPTSISWWSTLLMIWSLGIGMALITAIRNLIRSKSAKTSTELKAFTFMKRIHLAPELDREERKKIYAHEQVHADQLHTLDLIWYELLRIVFWFNPIFLFGRRSLKTLHEYIADHEANKITKDYPETLLASAFGLSVLPLANEFNSMNIKNRIKMITKKKSAGQRASLLGSALIVALATISIGWTAVIVPSELGKEEVYDKVEKMPHFPGCDKIDIADDELKQCSMKLLMDFMGKNIKYPAKAEQNNDEGTVMVKFVVTSSGEITKASVVKNVTEELDAESLRVINSMPNWVPGEHEGQQVNVAVVLPIRFALS